MRPNTLRSALTASIIALACVSAMPAHAQMFTDAEVAARMLRANAGNAQEQYLLGVMYEQGKGVPQNYDQAMIWYRKAADQKHSAALLSVGNLYDKGIGVPQSYNEAANWYLKAAKVGNAQAMYFIASMSYNGEGMPTDLGKALKWFELAKQQGYGPAGIAATRVKAELDKIQGQQSPATTAASKSTDQPAIVQTAVLAAPQAEPTPQAEPAPAPAPAPEPEPEPEPEPVPAPADIPSDLAQKPGFAVQIGSFVSAERAQSHLDRLHGKYPEIITTQSASIARKELADGRVFYRLNAQTDAQKSEAQTFCATLKTKSVDCLVVKY